MLSTLTLLLGIPSVPSEIPADSQIEDSPPADTGLANPPRAMNYLLPRWPIHEEQLILSTTESQTRLFIRKQEPAPTIRHLRLLEDLRETVAVSPFGISERCSAEKLNSDITVTCAAGSDIAGVSLLFDGLVPPSAAVQAHVIMEGSEGFLLQIVNSGDDATRPLPASQQLSLELPSQIDAPLNLVILAPEKGGTLRLANLELRPIPAPRPLNASAWAWQLENWQNNPELLIRKAAERHLARIYIALVITDGQVQHTRELASLVRAATRENIAVEAVEGDPRMVLHEGLSHGLERAQAIARYQRSASAETRLAGVQYDIEPYVLSDWGSAPVDYGAWSVAVKALAKAVESPVDLVLPFWLMSETSGLTFLREIQGAVSGVTVMSYRADAALAAALAQPLLHWGVTANIPVRIALEAGPVASESEETFVLAQEGRLALFDNDGQVTAMLFPETTVVAGARMYASRGTVRTRSDRISFLGNEQQMVDAARHVAQVASAWESFAGIGYHGLSWSER